MLSVKGVKGDMNVLIKEQMEEIYRRNCDMIYRVCLLQLKHEQDALDAVSETLVRLFQKKPDFADTEHEKAWLIRTRMYRKVSGSESVMPMMQRQSRCCSRCRHLQRTEKCCGRYGDYLLHMRNFYICIIMRDTVLRRLQ